MQLTSIHDITPQHRHIFLSPHFDDVVYSCGGTLGVQVSCGLTPLVITIFGGIPDNDGSLSSFARQQHRQMGASSNESIGAIVERRRQEDAAALDSLGVDYLWLDYPEAIYRGNPAYYTSEEQLIGGEVNPNDLWIDKQLALDLLALQNRLPDVAWYVPLGIGRHVDHQIVSSTADRLVQHGSTVYLYEEFPYVLEAKALDARLNELGGSFEPALVEMSEMLPFRLEAADLYTSQVQNNFANREEMHRLMTEYTHSLRPVETVHLERYWTVR